MPDQAPMDTLYYNGHNSSFLATSKETNTIYVIHAKFTLQDKLWNILHTSNTRVTACYVLRLFFLKHYARTRY